jgi:diamine N-acetyltransferase
MLRLRSRRSPSILARGNLCVVRALARPDVDRWLEWPRHPDPLFQEFNPPMMTARQRDNYYDRERSRSDARQFAVEDLQGEFVGRLNLREIDWFARTAVLGISFRADRLGEGLGTDGLRAFLEYYFHSMRMSALFLDVAAHNSRARRCYEKCGFRYIGEHWSESVPDLPGIFRHECFADLRPSFRRDGSLVRALHLDMVVHLADLQRAVRIAQEA